MVMLEHINNILMDINKLLKDSKYKYEIENINIIKKDLQYFKNYLEEGNDIFFIDLARVKELSNLIYDLNSVNLFSTLTDHISNELFAFEFLIQEKLKRKAV